MRKILLVLILAGAGWIGWKVYQRVIVEGAAGEQRPRNVAVAVEVAPVRVASIRDVGSFTGTLQADSRFEVAPKIGGRLERLAVNIGDRVKRGDLIAALDDDEIVQQLDQVRAELAVAGANLQEARSNLENVRREYDRVLSLREKKIASQSELDEADAALAAADAREKVALAQVNQREAAVKAAEVRLSYSRILADWKEGSDERVVGERFVDEGAMLSANAPIVSILDIGRLIAVIQVIERDYSKVRIGQEAVISTDAYPGRTFPGRIIRLAPLLRETSRQARVEIQLDNLERLLKPGMFVRVEIEFEERQNAVVVPTAAQVKREGEPGVFAADLEAMTARFVPVLFGISSGGLTEVLDPTGFSGHVVTLGQHLLEDGSTIVLPGNANAKPRTSGEAIPSASGSPGQEKTRG